MSNTYFLSMLISGMALLLVPAQAGRKIQEKQPVQSAQQVESHVEIPDGQVEMEEPQIEMDVERDEPEVDVEIDHDDVSFSEHEQEKIEKSFAMPAGAGRRTVEIDNVWGSIEVVGTASDQVKLTVNKSIRA